MNTKKVVSLCLIVVTVLLVSAMAEAADNWLDTGIGAISPVGNVLAIERIDETSSIVFSWDNSTATYIAFMLDNEGNLIKSPVFGFEYLYLDMYPSYVKIYGASPGGSWHYLFTMQR